MLLGCSKVKVNKYYVKKTNKIWTKKAPKKVKRKANEQASKFGKTANHRPMHRAGSELSWLQSVSLAAGGVCWSCAVGRSRAGRCAEQRGPSWAWLRPAGEKVTLEFADTLPTCLEMMRRRSKPSPMIWWLPSTRWAPRSQTVSKYIANEAFWSLTSTRAVPDVS